MNFVKTQENGITKIYSVNELREYRARNAEKNKRLKAAHQKGANAILGALENGFFMIRNGIFLESAESLIEAQKDWGEEDHCKNFDFSESPLWLTTNDEQSPQAISSTNDLLTFYMEN